MTKVQIDLSILAEPIPAQLLTQEIDLCPTIVLDWERKRKAIALLRVAGLLPSKEAYRVEGRLVRVIKQSLEEKP